VNKRRTSLCNMHTCAISNANSVRAIEGLSIGEERRVGCHMRVCTKISKLVVIGKLSISLSSHGSKLHGRVVALVGVIHTMIAVQGAVTAFTTNLTRGVLSWRWGNTGRIGVDRGIMRLE
jgi:hypothetical protein